jgi:hypothetical protein
LFLFTSFALPPCTMPHDQLLVPVPSLSRQTTKKVATRSIFVWPLVGVLFGFLFTVINIAARPCYYDGEGLASSYLEDSPDLALKDSNPNPPAPPTPPPYGDICDPEIIGEKQPWNQHKKIISYALFAPGDGTKPEDLVPAWAFNGVRFNSDNAKALYPDWIIRLHTVGLSKSDEEVLLQNSNVEIVRCKRFHSRARMMMARFLAVDDPNVLYTIVRDLDSRLNFRELMAVNEWIASGLGFHSMRDHKLHRVPVMGCCFGMRRGMFGNATSMTELVQGAITKYPKAVPGCCGDDQSFLSMFVWPRVKSTTMDHDSTPGRGKRYGSKECRDFPSFPRAEGPKLNFFVGAAFKIEEYVNLPGYTCSHQCSAPALVS